METFTAQINFSNKKNPEWLELEFLFCYHMLMVMIIAFVITYLSILMYHLLDIIKEIENKLINICY